MDMRKKYIELHLHLDGAITPDIAKDLANLQRIKLPYNNECELEKALMVSKDCRSLNQFLTCFKLPCSLLQTKEGIARAVYLVQENIKRQGVVYAEIRFAPQLHMEKGLTMMEVVESALDGLKKSDLKCNLILCCMRLADNKELNLQTVRIAKKYLVNEYSDDDFGVVAVDLAGAEALYKTEQFEDVFRLANELNVPFTIHAGEADGAESVKKAVEFGARRIGHGVNSIQNSQVIKMLAEKKICLEMCPTSNLQTKAIERIEDFPIREFMKAGIPVTINTDDMAICGTEIGQEMNLIKEKFNITDEEENKIYANAVRYSFAKNIIKKQLMEVL